MIDKEFKREIESWAERIENDATVEEAINCLSVLDSVRKRIDRIQADPAKRPTPRVMYT